MIVSFSCFMLAPSSAVNTFRFQDERKLRSYLGSVGDTSVLPVIDKTEREKFTIYLTVPRENFFPFFLHYE